MNLSYDTSRCVGRNMVADADDFIACPDREQCDRYLQMARDRANGLHNYQGIPVMANGRDMDNLDEPCELMIGVAE
jgi:hypothetical protein